MSLFSKFGKKQTPTTPTPTVQSDNSGLAETALAVITDGVIMVDNNFVIKYANPAAATMVGYRNTHDIIGLDLRIILKFEDTNGARINQDSNFLTQAIQSRQSLISRDYVLISVQSERKAAIQISVLPASGVKPSHLITFRNITKELEEEHSQSDFISTASHEMRTPVASIEGYLGLALNPATATIDDRARGYLETAHSAAQHLGRLFRDLLDVTKLDDKRLKPHFVPVDAIATVREMAKAHEPEMTPKRIRYSFGSAEPLTQANRNKLEPTAYINADLDFLREILDNLIENAIKYTPDGGEIWVNVRSDGDKVLINVTDTGIGVSVEDAAHIFQKFYRVDNSQTRQIGGTGLGLYLVKQRVEAMNGRVWVESSFGDGSTFFVSLPRLTDENYEKLRVAYQNQQAVEQFKLGQAQNNSTLAQSQPMPAQPIAPTPLEQPVAPTPTAQPQTSSPSIPQTPPTTPQPTPPAPPQTLPQQSPPQPTSPQSIPTQINQGV